jgi:IS5 family transposase
MRFLNLSLCDVVPDAKTIWLFREKLSKNNGIKKLFGKLEQMLKDYGFVARSGQIVDASIIETPKRRNISKKDKELIKNNKRPRHWSKNKKRQTDVNARWTFRGDIPYFGYKNHINIDKKHRLIRKWEVTNASVHDSRVFEFLYDHNNRALSFYADAAYRSRKIELFLIKKGNTSEIQWKKPANKELNPSKKTMNYLRSKVRGVVEHVFARQKSQMNLFVNTVGIKRAKAKIGLANLVYNLTRFEFLMRKIIPTP